MAIETGWEYLRMGAHWRAKAARSEKRWYIKMWRPWRLSHRTAARPPAWWKAVAAADFSGLGKTIYPLPMMDQCSGFQKGSRKPIPGGQARRPVPLATLTEYAYPSAHPGYWGRRFRGIECRAGPQKKPSTGASDGFRQPASPRVGTQPQPAARCGSGVCAWRYPLAGRSDRPAGTSGSDRGVLGGTVRAGRLWRIAGVLDRHQSDRLLSLFGVGAARPRHFCYHLDEPRLSLPALERSVLRGRAGAFPPFRGADRGRRIGSGRK